MPKPPASPSIAGISDLQKWTGRGAGDTELPTVTLLRRGDLSLNPPAFKALGESEYICIYFSEESNSIVLVASDKSDPGAARIREQTSGSFTTLRAAKFVNYYEIDHSIAKRYVAKPIPEEFAPTLLISLDTWKPAPAVRVPGMHPSRSRKQAGNVTAK